MFKTINDAAQNTPVLAEGKVKVYYTRDPRGEDVDATIEGLIMGYMVSPTTVLEKYNHKALKGLMDFTHTLMGEIKGSDDIEDIFMALQGEIWSPNGEARDLVIEKESTHTSMSVGDIIELEDGRMFICAGVGFTEI